MDLYAAFTTANAILYILHLVGTPKRHKYT